MAIMSALLALGSAAASARSWQSGPLSVEVLDARSAPFEQFPASGSGGEVYRAYLKAEKGASYRIHVRNRSGERVGLVIAVDGRNIVSGERSDLKRTEAMYVLEPWADAEYAGWRSNLSSVNEFYFTDWRDSYAEAIGDRSARGVIAVAAFPERVQYRPRPPVEQGYEPRSYDGERGDYSRRDKSEPEAAARSAAQAPAPSLGASADANSARSKSSASEAGTGYGERRWDPARRVEFEAQSAPMAKVFLKYEWAEKLCERGISCDPPRRQRNRLWHEDDYGFVPPPPATRRGW
jgi:hypothetical protein